MGAYVREHNNENSDVCVNNEEQLLHCATMSFMDRQAPHKPGRCGCVPSEWPYQTDLVE